MMGVTRVDEQDIEIMNYTPLMISFVFNGI